MFTSTSPNWWWVDRSSNRRYSSAVPSVNIFPPYYIIHSEDRERKDPSTLKQVLILYTLRLGFLTYYGWDLFLEIVHTWGNKRSHINRKGKKEEFISSFSFLVLGVYLTGNLIEIRFRLSALPSTMDIWEAGIGKWIEQRENLITSFPLF